MHIFYSNISRLIELSAFKIGYGLYEFLVLSKYTTNNSTVMSCAFVGVVSGSWFSDLEWMVIAFSLKIYPST